MPSRKVWLKLQSPSGETPVFVKLPNDAIVAECQEALHAKSPDLLGGINPAQLKAYRDTTAFQEGELLTPDTVIGTNLGMSWDKSIILQIPELIRPFSFCLVDASALTKEHRLRLFLSLLLQRWRNSNWESFMKMLLSCTA